MKTEVKELIQKSFLDAYGPAWSAFGIFATVTVYIFNPANIWQRIIMAVLMLLVLLLMTSIPALTLSVSRAYNMRKLPRIIRVVETTVPGRGRTKIFTIEASEWFTSDSMVSFFECDGDGCDVTERIIALGNVHLIQDNRLIQVILTHVLPGYQEDVDRMYQNDKSLLEKIRIKPFVPKAYLDDFYGKE
ncbi:MAG: hypothetical protein ACM3QZ_02035 [Solirubrobacterales bacterium]